MMRTTNIGSVAATMLFALSTGCGNDSSTGAPAGGANTPRAPGFADLLVDDSWSVDPGAESYYCKYQTLEEDLYVSKFRPLMPQGTHHVVLGYQEPARPDGFVPAIEGAHPTAEACTGITFGDVFAFAGTVGTQELAMPEGVAVKIPAGKQLVLGLHFLNTGITPMTGKAGVQAVEPDAADVVHTAEVIAAQSLWFTVPPGPSTVDTTCTMIGDSTIFAVMPHMHKAGIHMTTTAGPGGTGTTLLDQDYVFTEQSYTNLDPPVELKQGEQMNVECDYDNIGSDTLTVGESTTKNEMCITFAYRYPALALDAPVDSSPGFPMPRGWCVK
jgi:Copper type II ascorbate-dependent monooxygenase, C-terminal domain